MTRKEKEEISAIIVEIENADDKIDILERLYFTVKKMVKL